MKFRNLLAIIMEDWNRRFYHHIGWNWKHSFQVTNHTVGGDGGIPKPALGESWKTLPHVRLLLSRDCGSDTYHVSLLKHPSIVSSSVPSIKSLDIYLWILPFIASHPFINQELLWSGAKIALDQSRVILFWPHQFQEIDCFPLYFGHDPHEV